MRIPPTLAIAGLLASLAGCSAPPQALSPEQTPRLSDKAVTLRTQGLLTAKLVDASVSEIPWRELDPTQLNTLWGHLVLGEETPPLGATSVQSLRLEPDTTPARYLPADAKATHTFHQFAAMRDEDLAQLEFNHYRYVGGQREARPVAFVSTSSGKLRLPEPDAGYFMEIRIKEQAPASLVVRRGVGEGKPTHYEFLRSFHTYSYSPVTETRLKARIRVANAKGDALTGMTREHLEFDLKRKSGTSEVSTSPMALELTEPEKGLYEVSASSWAYSEAKPDAYVVELGFKNKPMIKDVEY